jgi:hypothetical protein
MDAVSAGSSIEGLSRNELNDEVEKIEREVRRRLPIGWSTSWASLVREFVTLQGYSASALERTLYVMEKREIVRFSGQVSSIVLLNRPRQMMSGRNSAMMLNHMSPARFFFAEKSRSSSRGLAEEA